MVHSRHDTGEVESLFVFLQFNLLLCSEAIFVVINLTEEVFLQSLFLGLVPIDSELFLLSGPFDVCFGGGCVYGRL